MRSRSLRASALTTANVVGASGLRLASNLVLTRLLFPEAFGLMALVQVFIYGLQMFSDIGINVSVIQSKRGDDRSFLDTAWTIQIMRGGLLWLVSLALAYPAAAIYDQPDLVLLLPLTALSVLFMGFQPTRVITADRHLKIGRVVAVDLGAQVLSILIMLLLAWWWRSVVALAVGTVVAAALRTTLQFAFLPGKRDSFRLDRTAAREILSFGAYVFLATVAAFAINMGGRALLGAHVSAAVMGVFSIGLILGAVPEMIATTVAQRVLFPLYRLRPPDASPENQRNLFRAHRLVAGFAICLSMVLAFSGVWLVTLLYDARYANAGPVVVLIACALVPSYAVIGSKNALLAKGDSRRHFHLQAVMAVAILTTTYVGLSLFGIVGMIAAPAIAHVLVYPFRARLTARYGAWDPVGELSLIGLGLTLGAVAIWVHRAEIVSLLQSA